MPYRFDPKSIVDVRNMLGMKQAEMARKLGVPANTLSRWETGKTTPDARSLAGIYSIAQEGGLNASFFRQISTGYRNRLVVTLDFQNLGVSAGDVPQFDNFIMNEVDRVAPSAEHEVFKAFGRPDQQGAIAELRRLKWRTLVEETDLDHQIIQETKSNCGHDPDDTVLLICTRDGDFTDLIKEMRDWGVVVYLIGPADASRRLVEEAGWDFWIQWSPPSRPGFVCVRLSQ